MKIIGTGIDIVGLAKIRELLQSSERHFETSCFTDSELAGFSLHNKVQDLAGCFAAKESVLKALGTGWTQGIAWTDIEIVKRDSAIPTVLLRGKCSEIALSLGITDWALTISNCRSCAIASAVASRQDVLSLSDLRYGVSFALPSTPL
ncbi:MAG: holo-[acyl-carrier protein] synthase [Blastocatellia bacterium]|jgi:holo-[acyl-carrier protein] synthase|nr:holo-[acyl-carrier protein] synthase [Blastocatellia bacterium]